MHITALRPRDLTADLESLARETQPASSLREELEAPHRALWVARWQLNTLPSGFCVCRQVLDETEILALGVLEDQRRQGVARALLRHVARVEATRGTRRLTLEVKSDNSAAIALYSSCHFEQFGRRIRYYRDGKDALELEHVLAK